MGYLNPFYALKDKTKAMYNVKYLFYKQIFFYQNVLSHPSLSQNITKIENLKSSMLTPFPRPYYRTYAIAALITGLSIAFILNVFQPFGTSSFTHPYKFWILSGYGIVVTLTILLYYYLSLAVIHKNRDHKWTVLHEVLDYLMAAILGMLATYCYYNLIFDRSFSLTSLYYFLGVTLVVNLLPMMALAVMLYMRYKDVVRSEFSIESVDSDKETSLITLTGVNRTDKVTTPPDNILYIKAEDNYVILHLLTSENAIQKHMFRSTLKDIKNQLMSDTFVQCHRSYVVNTNRVKGIEGNKSSSKLIVNGSPDKLLLSRSKYDLFNSMN